MADEKIPVAPLVVCEGKYDKIKLESVIDADIIALHGFGIFKDEEKKALIRRASSTRGVIVVTDSDSAGMVIRNYINGITGGVGVYHIYTPRVEGKEKRKSERSKEGVLGVEGISAPTLRALFEKHRSYEPKGESPFTRLLFYEDGLIGAPDAQRRREELCQRLSLPLNMSVTALLSALDMVCDIEEYKRICEELKC